MKTRKIAMDAMLSALCAVLGYVSLDLGNLKITFESFPILLGALLFGPLDGLCIGGIGTLLYQLARYGVTLTTPLWMAPYLLEGAVAGWYAKRYNYTLHGRQIMVAVVASELMVTILNTGVLYVDSIIYGYYSAVYIFGSLFLRIMLSVGKGIAFGLVLPSIMLPVCKKMYHEGGTAK